MLRSSKSSSQDLSLLKLRSCLIARLSACRTERHGDLSTVILTKSHALEEPEYLPAGLPYQSLQKHPVMRLTTLFSSFRHPHSVVGLSWASTRSGSQEALNLSFRHPESLGYFSWSPREMLGDARFVLGLRVYRVLRVYRA